MKCLRREKQVNFHIPPPFRRKSRLAPRKPENLLVRSHACRGLCVRPALRPQICRCAACARGQKETAGAYFSERYMRIIPCFAAIYNFGAKNKGREIPAPCNSEVIGVLDRRFMGIGTIHSRIAAQRVLLRTHLRALSERTFSDVSHSFRARTSSSSSPWNSACSWRSSRRTSSDWNSSSFPPFDGLFKTDYRLSFAKGR